MMATEHVSGHDGDGDAMERRPAMMATVTSETLRRRVSGHQSDGNPLGAMRATAGHDGDGDPRDSTTQGIRP